jgi:hypothetical protein
MQATAVSHRNVPVMYSRPSGIVAAGVAVIVLSWAAGSFEETYGGPMWFVYIIAFLLVKGAYALGARRQWPFTAASVIAAALWIVIALEEPFASPGAPSYIILVLVIWGVLECIRAAAKAFPKGIPPNASASSRSLTDVSAPPKTNIATAVQQEPPLTCCYYCGSDVNSGSNTCPSCGKKL